MDEQSCPINATELPKEIEIVSLVPQNRVHNYQEAAALAKDQAALRFEEYMLISWYDRDRDFESPPNTTECGNGSEKNGYIRYGVTHGARLKVDVEEGRFVFFFSPVEW